MNNFHGFTELDQLDFQMAQGAFETENERLDFEKWLDELKTLETEEEGEDA